MLGYQKLGKTGDWIICWPSLYNDHTSFSQFTTALARDHRVLVIDSPGMGFSKNIPWPSLGALELSTMGIEVIDKEVANEPFHFIGHGIGGHIGLEIAVKNPNCKTLTLSGVPLNKEADSSSGFYYISCVLAKLGLFSKFAKSMIMRKYSVTGLERKPINAVLDKTLKHANINTVLKFARPTQYTIDHHRELLHRLRQPVLVIAGEHDEVVMPEDQRDVANLAKHGTFVQVTSGFMTFLTASAECSRCWLQHKRACAEKL